MQCMHDMATHERCNLTKLNGTEIPTFTYMVQVIFLNIKIKCYLASINNVWVSYPKLNGIGITIKLDPKHSICN